MTAMRAPDSRRAVKTRKPSAARQLVGSLHAQRLENLGRGVTASMHNNFSTAFADCSVYMERTGLALFHQLAGNAPRGRLSPRITEEAASALLPVGCGGPSRPCARAESIRMWSGPLRMTLKPRSAFSNWRDETRIEQCSANSHNFQLVQHRGVAEVDLPQRHWATRRNGPFAGVLDRVGILIKRQDIGGAGAQDFFGMTPAPASRIHDSSASPRSTSDWTTPPTRTRTMID